MQPPQVSQKYHSAILLAAILPQLPLEQVSAVRDTGHIGHPLNYADQTAFGAWQKSLACAG